MPLADELDKSLVLRQRGDRERIAVGTKPTVGQFPLDSFDESVDLQVVDVLPLHHFAHEDAFKDFPAPPIDQLTEFV